MAPQDPNPQGGSITDMAVEGTRVPDDAGTQNTIPSVPRPDQVTDPSTDPNNLGATDLAGAADNAQDVSRVRHPSLVFFIKAHDYIMQERSIDLSLSYCRPRVILPLVPKSLPAQATLCLQRLARSVFTTT